MVDKLLNAHAVLELDALLGDTIGKADGVPVDVAGEVRGREVTSKVVAARERGLDLADLVIGDGTALESALCVQLGHLPRVRVLLGI